MVDACAVDDEGVEADMEETVLFAAMEPGTRADYDLAFTGSGVIFFPQFAGKSRHQINEI